MALQIDFCSRLSSQTVSNVSASNDAYILSSSRFHLHFHIFSQNFLLCLGLPGFYLFCTGSFNVYGGAFWTKMQLDNDLCSIGSDLCFWLDRAFVALDRTSVPFNCTYASFYRKFYTIGFNIPRWYSYLWGNTIISMKSQSELKRLLKPILKRKS